MIITDLQAEDFRKYENLHLENLPESGLIAVNGNNEAGKSSIGDALCFALFGRTDKLSGEQIGKLVRWGQQAVKITLSFSHKDKQYRLTRMADTSGTQTASLWSIEEGRTLADSSDAVTIAIKKILGYGYPAFIRTFYWGQKVNEDGQADAESLQAMAGIKTYIKLNNELRQEQEADATNLTDLEQQSATINAKLDTLAIDQDYLPALVDLRETLATQHQGNLKLTHDINDVRESYTQQHGLFHRFKRRSQLTGWITALGIIFLLLAILSWALLTFMPELLDSIRPVTENEQNTWGRTLLWGGVIVAILTSLLMIYDWHLGRNCLDPLRNKSLALASTLQDGADQLNRDLTGLLDADAAKHLKHELLDANVNDLKPWQSDPDHLRDLSEQVRDFRAAPLDTIAAADGVSMALENQGEWLSGSFDAVDRKATAEQQRVDQYMALNTEMSHYQSALEQQQHHIQLKAKGITLLQRASRHAIKSFNRIVHSRCSSLLSEFTQSGYNKLEIDNNFMPRVLSEAKGDYLDFEEISAGTQRQIALAMRMSLAGTLAASTDTDGQFIFLDEPFAFFDPERTTATINSLTSATSGNLSQIWVTVQDIPPDLNAAFTIHCQQETPVLHVGGLGL